MVARELRLYFYFEPVSKKWFVRDIDDAHDNTVNSNQIKSL